jgi:hypothetical protein
MAEQSTCLSPLCGITIEGSEKKCPKCGWAMRSARNIRTRGWFLLACGLFITLFMGWIAWRLWPTLMLPGKEVEGGGSFSGTKDQAQMILGLFGIIILFGMVGTANALYMITSGRQSRVFVIVTLLLAVAIAVSAWLTTRMLK